MASDSIFLLAEISTTASLLNFMQFMSKTVSTVRSEQAHYSLAGLGMVNLISGKLCPARKCVMFGSTTYGMVNFWPQFKTTPGDMDLIGHANYIPTGPEKDHFESTGRILLNTKILIYCHWYAGPIPIKIYEILSAKQWGARSLIKFSCSRLCSSLRRAIPM